MFTAPSPPDFSRVARFEERLAALDTAAWDRIAERCAALDGRTLDGFFGRIELLARANIPNASPYAKPGAVPAMALMGTFFGTLNEVSMMFDSPEPWERSAAKLRQEAGTDERKLAEAASQALRARAVRERARRPGLAAALVAVQMGLLLSTADPAGLASVYAPFEPEIPVATLFPADAG